MHLFSMFDVLMVRQINLFRLHLLFKLFIPPATAFFMLNYHDFTVVFDNMQSFHSVIRSYERMQKEDRDELSREDKVLSRLGGNSQKPPKSNLVGNWLLCLLGCPIRNAT
jgi:hypothetical protein